MATLREWFDDFTAQTGETPTQIVFGGPPWWRDSGDGWPIDRIQAVINFTGIDGTVLDREFDASWGGNETPNLCAWSPSWVIFSDNYDGSEGLQWVPRSPVDHDPIRPGGG